MAIERISAVAQAPQWSRGRTAPPAPGEALPLRFSGTTEGDLLATTPEGVPLRLAGLAHLGRGLLPGDMLLARVVATTPTLELELVSPQPAQKGDAARDDAPGPAAMQVDQAALRRVVIRLPDAAALAAAWHRALRQAAAREAPPRPLLPGPSIPVLAVEDGARPAAAERWAVPVFAWGGMPAALYLLPLADDPPRGRRRPISALALMLELDLSGLGTVGIQVRRLSDGIGIVLTVEDAAAAAVRAAVPAIAAALARAELRVLRLELQRRHAVPGGAAAAPPPRLAAAVSPGLLRAAAEVTVALLARALPGEPGSV